LFVAVQEWPALPVAATTSPIVGTSFLSKTGKTNFSKLSKALKNLLIFVL